MAHVCSANDAGTVTFAGRGAERRCQDFLARQSLEEVAQSSPAGRATFPLRGELVHTASVHGFCAGK